MNKGRGVRAALGDQMPKKKDLEPAGEGDRSRPTATADKKRGVRAKKGIGAEAMLHAAKVLLRTASTENLTQSQVAKAAGVDDRMLRYHFGDLEGLLDRLTEVMIDEFSERMAIASRPGASATRRIQARIDTQLDYIAENPRFFWLIFDRFYHRTDEASKIGRTRFNKTALARLEDVIRAGRREGQLDKNFDPRHFYLAAIGMTAMFGQVLPIIEVLFEGADVDSLRAEYAGFLHRLVLNGIGAGGAVAVSTAGSKDERSGVPPVADARLRELEEENLRLRHLLTDAMLEAQAAKRKKGPHR